MCWCICNSVIHHFKSDYDAVKYRYKMPWFTPNKYGGDRNQWWYQGISKKLVWQDEVVKLAYVNAAEGNYYVRDFDQGLYDELNKFLQSQTYEFEKDLKKLKERNDNFDYWLSKMRIIKCTRELNASLLSRGLQHIRGLGIYE